MSWLKGLLKHLLFLTLCLLGRSVRELREHPPQKGEIRRILVIAGGGIGDVLRAFPAIQALQRAFPSAAIAALVTEPHEEVLKLYANRRAIADWILMDIGEKHRSLLAKLALILALRRRAFDLVYNPSRGVAVFEHALLAFLIGAPYRIGFDIEGLGYLTTTRLAFQGDRSILHQNLSLLERAGIGTAGTEILLSVHERDLTFAKELFDRYGIGASHQAIVIHPSARWQDMYRTWPFPRYVALIQALLRDPMVFILLLGDRRERAKVGEGLGGLQHPRLINVVGETSLGQAAAVLQASRLFVGNDSGLLHIALALKVPAVAIFGATAPEQVLSPSSSCLVVQKGVPCQPCYRHQPFEALSCSYNFKCLNLLSVSEVFRAVGAALHRDACASGADSYA